MLKGRNYPIIRLLGSPKLGQKSSMSYEGLFLNKKLLLPTFVELYDNGAWGYCFLLLGALSV